MLKSLVPAATLLTLLTACGSEPTPSATAATTAPATSGATAATTTAAAKGPDACTLVSKELLVSTLGVVIDSQQAKQSNVEGSTCDYKDSTGTKTIIVVQTSAKPDTYFPKSLADQYKDTVPLTAQADRGFVQKPVSHNGHVQLVRNGVGVDITIYAQAPYTVEQEQALATAIAAKL